MNPVTKTANQQTHFKQQKDKVLIYCNLSDSKRQQTFTVDYKRLINGLLLTNDVSLQYKDIANLKTTLKQDKTKLKTMAKQSKNKVKLNSEYEHLGTFTKSALTAIRVHFDVPEGANKIRANMTNTLKHNKKHFSQIEKYLEQLVLTKEGYVRYIVSNFNQIRLGSQPKSLVLVVTDASTNHIAAIHLVFEKNENFWLVKSVRVDRAEDMERKKLVWSK